MGQSVDLQYRLQTWTMLSLLVPVLLSAGLTSQMPSEERNSGYECQYLSSHKELSCQCSGNNINIADLALLLSSTPGPVESLKLGHCHSLDLSLDVVRVVQPFYQLRLEAVDQVRLHGVRLSQQSNLDIVMRNVRQGLAVLGDIHCVDCRQEDGDDVRLQARPTLILQVKNATNASFHYLDVSDVNIRLSLRNVENVNIDSTVFDNLAKNAIEVWHSKRFEVTNSVVKESEEKAIVTNHVESVRLHNTLGILNSSLLIMSDLTRLEMMCTARYTRDFTLELLSWSAELCSPLSLDGIQLRSGESPKAGTIVVTVLCGVVVFIVIIVLCYLNKTGKLNNLL